jgi:predicted phage tail protein
MMRKVYLEGEMGERFGTGFPVNAPTVKDVIKCVECNHPSFKKYLMDCHEKDIGFEIDVASNKLDYAEEMLMNLQEGDVTITPIPAGSQSGGAKILGAIALIAIAVFAAPLLGTAAQVSAPMLGGGGLGVMGAGTTVAATGLSAGAISAVQLGLGMLAVNLGMMGLSQVMAPDPATDADQEQNYLFNGNQQNIVEGDPIPILYGQLRVPGQPVNFEVAGVKSNIWRSVMIGIGGQSRGTA